MTALSTVWAPPAVSLLISTVSPFFINDNCSAQHFPSPDSGRLLWRRVHPCVQTSPKQRTDAGLKKKVNHNTIVQDQGSSASMLFVVIKWVTWVIWVWNIHECAVQLYIFLSSCVDFTSVFCPQSWSLPWKYDRTKVKWWYWLSSTKK